MSTSSLPRFDLRPRARGLAGLLLCALSAGGCGSDPASATVRFAPADPSAIEVAPEGALLGFIALAEIEITPDGIDFAPLAGDSEADGVAQGSPGSPERAAADWRRAMTASAAPRSPEASLPESYGAMGGGVGLGAYAWGGELAPVRKSFTTRAGAPPAQGVEGVGEPSRRERSGAGSSGLSAHRPAGPGPRSLGAEEIKRGVQSQLGRVRACYERGLKGAELLSGRLVLAFSVQPDGGVHGAKVGKDELGSDKVAQCVVAAVGAFRFPEGTETVAVEYPMHFRPDGAW